MSALTEMLTVKVTILHHTEQPTGSRILYRKHVGADNDGEDLCDVMIATPCLLWSGSASGMMLLLVYCCWQCCIWGAPRHCFGEPT